MTEAVLCARCGAPLPAHAAHAVVTCTFCGTSAQPAPKVIERVVDRVVVVAAAQGGAPGVPACPRCAEPTRAVDVRSERVYVCPACGGVLLSTAQVEAFTRRNDEDLVTAARRAVAVIVRPTRKQAALSCPACAGPLRTSQIGETVQLMYTCAAHGTFFDYGALSAFAEMWVERRAGEISEDDLERLGLK